MPVTPEAYKQSPDLTPLEKNQEIEILDEFDDEPGVQRNLDGTITVSLGEENSEFTPQKDPESYSVDSDGHYSNLVPFIDPETLEALAIEVIENVQTDDQSRSDWLKTIEFGFDLLGVKVEEKNTPFPGACSAQHPLLMESAVKFQSKASNELLPSDGPVRTKVLGDLTLEKEKQANRVQSHMNYQITELMTEFYTDAERMLLYVPLVGSGFKKTYYSEDLERPVSEFVPADLFIVPNNASDLFRAPRYTHVIYKTEYELEQECKNGFYTKPEGGFGPAEQAKLTLVQQKTNELLGMEVGFGSVNKVNTLYEHHVKTCIPGLDQEPNSEYKLAFPYIITLDTNSNKIIGVRRNWKKGDKKRRKIVSFTHYNFVPSFNFYGFGYLHLLGNLQLSLTSSLRSLVDAGQFATLQGGFKLKGVRIIDDGTPIYPGQFKEIETAVQDISKALYPLPFKEPSQTLYQMLEFLDRKGQKFADSTEQVVADATNYGPVGTTMALLDATNKFFSAVHKRLHNSLKQELKIIARINAETLEDNERYNLENETMAVSRADYSDIVDVVPVSDPNISSNAHRMAKAQALLDMATRAPEIHDMREVLKHVYMSMDYLNIDKILPEPEQAQPNDPLTDIQMAVQGKPIKAFQGQDHKAHMAMKQAFMQDPMSGANPMMQKASIALQANVQEHMMLQFMEQTAAQAQMGQMPMDQAAQQVAIMNQQKLQQDLQNQEQSSKDKAAMILAQAELIDTQTQAKKQAFDELYKTADLELKKERLDMDKVKEINRAQEQRLATTTKISDLVQTKGLDAMIQGLSQAHDVKMEQLRIEAQKEMAKIKQDKPTKKDN